MYLNDNNDYIAKNITNKKLNIKNEIDRPGYSSDFITPRIRNDIYCHFLEHKKEDFKAEQTLDGFIVLKKSGLVIGRIDLQKDYELPFYQVKTIGLDEKYRGQGIGYAIHKMLIDYVGGLILDYSITTKMLNLWKKLSKEYPMEVVVNSESGITYKMFSNIDELVGENKKNITVLARSKEPDKL